jgi:MFS family permease
MLLVGTAEARGLSHQQAVALLGLMGVGTIVGRFCLAALADLLGRRLGFLLSCLGVSIAMMLWALADDAASLRGFALTQREIPGAGYAWDYPALGQASAALLPAAGGAERLHVRPWPSMAAQSAAEIAGFFAQHFSRAAP